MLTYELSINSFTGWPICENIIEIIFIWQKPSETPFLTYFEKRFKNGVSEGYWVLFKFLNWVYFFGRKPV